MKIALFSNDIELLKRWENLLPLYETHIIEDFEELMSLENFLLILNSDSCTTNQNLLVNKLFKNRNKILVLDRVPEFNKAKNWLKKGVQGYGNAIMTTSYINSAVESILSHHIWILPKITTQLLQNSINPSNNSESILQSLTTKEKEIALLLKQGYINSEISLELEISINTVKTHIKKIYEKLEVNDRMAFGMLFSN